MKLSRPILMYAGAAVGTITLALICAVGLRAAGGSFWTDADTIKEPSDRAPSRRVLWQPPARLALSTESEEYEPRYSADGQTLFFVRGKAGENADIYTSRRAASGWTDPEPIAAINTEEDDLGPQPSHDGDKLYFSSNREGSLGGYDLYVSTLENGSWTTPVNLGSGVNSAFDEYGPALTPDSLTLYFASNRPRPGETDLRAGEAWSATLRANDARHDFDLFIAKLENSRVVSCEPLAILNTTSSEGAPAVTPFGDFLYFSSDRPGGLGGYDLYRSRRLRGGHSLPEHLAALNSPFHDLDPGLGMGGYEIAFSSNRPRQGAEGKPADYDLYTGTSREVFLEREPVGLAGMWNKIWPILLWLLMLTALAWLLYRVRGALHDQKLSTLTKCLLASAMVHLFILFLMSLWGVTATIGKIVRERGTRVHLSGAGDGGGGAADTIASQVLGSGGAPAALPASPTLSAAPLSLPTISPPLPAFDAGRAAIEQAPVVASANEATPALAPHESALTLTPHENEPPARVPQESAPRAVTELAAHAPESQPLETAPPVPAASISGAQTPDPARQIVAAPNSDSPRNAREATTEVTMPQLPLALNVTGPTAAPAVNVPSDRAAAGGAEPGITSPTTPGLSTPSPAFAATTGTSGPTLDAPVRDLRGTLAGTPSTEPAREAALTRGSTPRGPATPASLPERAGAGQPGARVALPTEGVGGAVREASIGGGAAAPLPSGPAPGFAPVASSSPASGVGEPARAGAGLAAGTSATRDGLREASTGTGLPSTAAPTLGGAPGTTDLAGALRTPSEAGGGPAGAVEKGTETAGAGLRGVSIPSAPIAGLKGGSGRVEFDAGRAGGTALDASGTRSGWTSGAKDAAVGPGPSGIPPRSGDPLGGIATATPDIGIPTETAPPEDPYPQRAPEQRQALVERLGGSERTEQAVRLALAWLARHQLPDGRWGTTDFDQNCGQCGGESTIDSSVAATGLSLLAFLAADHTPAKDGPYRDNVTRGFDWLLKAQKPNGDLRIDESLYSHGIATIALCEVFAMTKDERFRQPAQRAIDFIADSRSERSIGWRYEPGQFGDTSVLGWQIMALVSARRAGLNIQARALDAGTQWLDLVSRGSPGLYAYQPGMQPTVSMTAEGLFVRQLLGAGRDEPRAEASVGAIMKSMPRWGARGSTYYWYYATLALFQHQGDEWKQWNTAVSETLLEHQRVTGASAGSWDPEDRHARVGSRVYQTALCTLILEVYYRYLPMYAEEKKRPD